MPDEGRRAANASARGPARPPAVAVMARPPVRGAVKTRLAAQLGDDAALAIYMGLLLGTLDQADLLDGVDLVLSAPRTPRGVHAPDPLAGRSQRWRRLEQRGAGLGERLAHLMADLFASGAAAVVVVNSDSPAIPVEYLERALASTGDGRLVLGPAADGGYYLIACGRALWKQQGDVITRLLLGSPMSKPSLLAETMRRAEAAGLELVQLPLWVDVDEPADLPVLARLAGDPPLRGEPLAGLREIYLHLTHACGRDCRHCYDRDAIRDPDELTTAEWKGAIDQCVALGASSFVFIGGDPLLRGDFLELVDHITGRHGAKARFFFNSLIDEELAAELGCVGRGLLRPLVSIDGPRHINDALRGAGSYDDVMASIDNLQAVGLDPVANAVLVRPVLPGLSQLARELRAAGVSRLHLILPHQAGGVGGEQRDAAELVPDAAEMLAVIRELVETATSIGLAVDNLSAWRRRIGARNDFCASGCRDLAVDPYGNIHACVITAGDPAFVAGSLRELPLERIWRDSASLRLLRASRARDRAECLVCPVVDACGGECWVQAHYAARAHDAPAGYAASFPYCDLVRPLLQELAATADPAAAEAAAPAGGDCAANACGGQAAAGQDAYSLFDCI